MPFIYSDELSVYFTVRALSGDQLVEIQLCGELDVCAVPKLHSAIGETVTARRHGPPTRVVLDLSELRFVDLKGLRAIVDARHLLTTEGFRVRIRSGRAADKVAKLLGMSLN